MPNPGLITSLADISAPYQGILSDVWGVLHNGIAPHPSAVDALVGYRQSGGRVILITNAARPGHVIAQMLDGMNITRDAYDGIVSSGDATRVLISAFQGENIHHIGPPTDNPIFDGIDVARSKAAEAQAVVVTGLEDPSETPDDYAERMTEWLALGLPMICANPDKVVEVGDKLVYCPGALADIYAERGGIVHIAGKPHAAIYDAALGQLADAMGASVPRDKVLAIGDSTRTDATGAAAAGLDLLFITGSIHAGELGDFENPDPQAIAEIVEPTGAKLIGYQPRLK